MEITNDDTVALVLSTNDDFEHVCVTEYSKDGTWHCGMNLITSLQDAVKTAHGKKLNILFENMLNKGV